MEVVANIKVVRSILKYFTSYLSENDKDLKNVVYILEPLSTVMRLALISFYPLGTKISIGSNSIHFVSPNLLQGTIRWSTGDKREDLHYLLKPIKKCYEWYSTRDSEEIKEIFRYAIKGLELLKKAYQRDAKIICHSLDSYIEILKKKSYKNKKKEENLFLRENFEELWSDAHINVIYELLKTIEREDEATGKYFIKAMENILDSVEGKVKKVLSKAYTLEQSQSSLII